MPRYLRWITAVTSAIVIEFALGAAVGAIAIGTKTKELHGGTGFLVALLGIALPIIVALAINDWLAARYPAEARPSRSEDARVP
jgi:hypothetical protein